MRTQQLLDTFTKQAETFYPGDRMMKTCVYALRDTLIVIMKGIRDEEIDPKVLIEIEKAYNERLSGYLKNEAARVVPYVNKVAMEVAISVFRQIVGEPLVKGLKESKESKESADGAGASGADAPGGPRRGSSI